MSLPAVKRLVRRSKRQRIRRSEIEERVAAAFGRETDVYADIMRACDLEKAVHLGEKRQDGEPLINHARAVVLILLVYLRVRDPDLIIAAFLHDVVEDHDEWEISHIAELFSYRAAMIVDAVTKPWVGADVSLEEKSARIFKHVYDGGYEARVLKYADRLHNMITLWGSSKKRDKKVRETLQYVIPMAVADNVLWKELTAATDEQVKRIKAPRAYY